MSSLSGKVAIVTGSARGIGSAIAIALAKEGASVVINYISPSSKSLAEQVAQTVESHGSNSLVVQANLGSLQDLDNLVQKTVEKFGKVDVLVNNAGYGEYQTIGGITLDSYSKMFDINVRSVIFLSQAVVPHMSDGGRIINVSSTAAREGNPGSAVYSASKAAVESITRVMGVELRDKGIRVNAVNPGPTETDLFFGLPAAIQANYRSSTPVAKPEDIADIVAFLAGPKSRWVNGGTVNANNAAVLN